PFEQACDPLPSRRGRDAAEVAKVVEVLGRSVAPIEPRLVRYDAEASADGVQAIGYAQAVELDQARVGAEDAAKAAQRGRLAGAVLAEQDQDLAALHVQVHARHGAHVGEALMQALDPDHLKSPIRPRRAAASRGRGPRTGSCRASRWRRGGRT